MALAPEDRQLLKSIYQKLKDQPLEPGDPLYQPVYDMPGCFDPVQLLKTGIDFSDVESMQMFSGFRGSGKTTELKRLRKQLEEDGYIVIYGDALKYLNPAEPIEIADLLIVLAGAFSDALEELRPDVQLVKESYWTRLTHYLTKTEVEVTEANIKTEADSVAKELIGGVKAGVDLKLALRTAPTFRQNLQKFLANRIGELKRQVDKFVEDGVKALRQLYGGQKQIVFIFDSLEQLRGSLANEKDVIDSVARLFANYSNFLKLPYVHCVYTVPPWLKFAMPGATNTVMLPSLRQWENDPARSAYQPGWQALRDLLKRRVGAENCAHVFGVPDAQGDHTAADQLIAVCGGHFRDLLLLLREAVVRADVLPLTERVINAAIINVRSNLLPVSIESARWLHLIEQTRTPSMPDESSESVSKMTRFIDTHLVLYLMNGKEWYDIHPLIREEVADIIARHGATAESVTQ